VVVHMEEKTAVVSARVDPSSPLRLRELHGVANLRDLGGLETPDRLGMVRKGCIFRSARLDGAVADDVRLLIEGLNVRLIVDLRDKKDAAPRTLLFRQTYAETGSLRKWISNPILGTKYKLHVFSKASSKRKLVGQLILDKFTGTDEATKQVCREAMNPGGLREQYTDMLEYSQKALSSALLHATQDANYPLLFHCIHGKPAGFHKTTSSQTIVCPRWDSQK